MKGASVRLLVAFSLFVAGFAIPQNRPCPKCNADYVPVCAVLRGEYRTFTNECLLNTANCRSQQPWRLVAKCACVDERGNPGSYRPSPGAPFVGK